MEMDTETGLGAVVLVACGCYYSQRQPAVGALKLSCRTDRG